MKKQEKKVAKVLKQNYQNNTVKDKKQQNHKFSVGKNKKLKNLHKSQIIKVKNKTSSSEDAQKIKKIISVDNNQISVSELATKIGVASSSVIIAAMKLQVAVTINQIIDLDVAQLIAKSFYCDIKNKEHNLEKSIKISADNGSENRKPRPPIVTIMGHVNHGKTTLLDYIRSKNTAKKEAGGITQNIKAYSIKTDGGAITLLDTPGHEVFTAMRNRGAFLTDIVILVVAANDGVMPQTVETIKLIKKFNIPTIVAVNKIDCLESDKQIVYTQLSKYGIIPDQWGGENIFIDISAKTGAGVKSLIEAILLQSEMMELTSINDNSKSSAVVLESSLEKGRGVVASVIINSGKLKIGDTIICGQNQGKIRAMYNDEGLIKQAVPSQAVEIVGLPESPALGDTITVINIKKGKNKLSVCRQKQTVECFQKNQTLLNPSVNIFGKPKKPTLNVILKAVNQGSLEAVSASLFKISVQGVLLNVVSQNIGEINESDVILAISTDSIILGFDVKVNAIAKKKILSEKITFICHKIIYHMNEDVQKFMKTLLQPKYNKKILGSAEVRDIFKLNKLGVIAGCLVTNGVLKKSKLVEVIRGQNNIYTGFIDSIKRFKNDISEAKLGIECGVFIKGFDNFQHKDVLQCFENVQVSQ